MNRKNSIKKKIALNHPSVFKAKWKRKAQQQQEEEEYYRPTHESAVYTVSTQYDFKDNPKINSIGRSQSQEHNLIKKDKTYTLLESHRSVCFYLPMSMPLWLLVFHSCVMDPYSNDV